MGAHSEDEGLPGKGGSWGSALGSAYPAGRRYMVSSLSTGLLFPLETSPKRPFLPRGCCTAQERGAGTPKASSTGCDEQVPPPQQIRVIDKRYLASVIKILTIMNYKYGGDETVA